MCESYARSLLRVSVAQICQALGWDAVQLTACDLLSDVLHRYIQQLARACHRYSELCKWFIISPITLPQLIYQKCIHVVVVHRYEHGAP